MNSLNNYPISNLSRDQWDQIVNALTFFIRVQTDELKKHNVGDREWQELCNYESTLRDIRFYVLPELNSKYEER